MTTSSVWLIAELRGAARAELRVHAGAGLLEACEMHGVALPYCCRSASCGSCRVEVLEGADALLPPDAPERELLWALDLDPQRFRLACQARIGPTAARIRVRALEA